MGLLYRPIPSKLLKISRGGLRAGHILFQVCLPWVLSLKPAFPWFFLLGVTFLLFVPGIKLYMDSTILATGLLNTDSYSPSKNGGSIIVDHFGNINTKYRHYYTKSKYFIQNGILPWEFNLNTKTNFVISYVPNNSKRQTKCQQH